MFDNVCKFLAENFSTNFANWLLGKNITFTKLSPSELSLEPIRADAIILLQSDENILHLEFQTLPKPDVPFRMADYRLRGYRRFPNKEMYQFVIYLQQTSSELAYKNDFRLTRTHHEFNIIRMWEQKTDSFLQYPGLLPFAALSQTDNRAQVLQQVAIEIEQIADQRQQSNVAASTAILAGLVLDSDLILRTLRSDIMRESVIYQEIEAQGEEKGVAKGRVLGREEEARLIALKLLNEGTNVDLIARVTGLTVEQVQQLRQN
ncbi:MAG: Rpn family recombination-promoting nuclease/putative transposase [Scytonematopsis contorta HA4267-MV1]|jgi:predicted transposase/invertase (TIGR01784 family)|nr:Rpn family recombination-promoting nuclease/putative transposase [Scytonematopsis contorta HA4267-MV1]